MKVRQLLCLICAVAMVLPIAANAQVYKWKDKNGKVNYTDTPPPINVEAKTMGKKKPQRPLAANAEPASESLGKVPEQEGIDPEETAARLRQRNAEIEKNNKQAKEAQAKIDAENCKAAKINYHTFARGGRITRTDENGEQHFYSDKEIALGKQKAQTAINKYCK